VPVTHKKIKPLSHPRLKGFIQKEVPPSQRNSSPLTSVIPFTANNKLR